MIFEPTEKEMLKKIIKENGENFGQSYTEEELNKLADIYLKFKYFGEEYQEEKEKP